MPYAILVRNIQERLRLAALEWLKAQLIWPSRAILNSMQNPITSPRPSVERQRSLRWFLAPSPPFIQPWEKKTLLLTPEISLGGLTALQCAEALSTHRRIDSTKALPHASSLGERSCATIGASVRFALSSHCVITVDGTYTHMGEHCIMRPVGG